METTTFTITPELPIGTEMWFMYKNKPEMCLIAGIRLDIDSHNGNGESWHKQLWSRWAEGKAKEYWRYSWMYTIKVKSDPFAYTIEKIKDNWYIHNKCQLFFTKEELLKSLT